MNSIDYTLLPPEIWEVILAEVPAMDALKSAMRVCKDWKQFYRTNNIYWEDRCEEEFQSYEIRNFALEAGYTRFQRRWQNRKFKSFDMLEEFLPSRYPTAFLITVHRTLTLSV